VLNEYNSHDEAHSDLMKILTNKKTEEQILKDYTKKKVL
jgi:hypothetical protein